MTHPGHAFVVFKQLPAETSKTITNGHSLQASKASFVSYRSKPWPDAPSSQGKYAIEAATAVVDHSLRVLEDKSRPPRLVAKACCKRVNHGKIIDLTKIKYVQKRVEGWKVNLAPQLESNKRVMTCIRADLKAVNIHLPSQASQILRERTAFWVNESLQYGYESQPVEAAGMCFHPSSEWLQQNRMMPEKKGAIEIYNTRDYVTSRGLWGQGGLLLHEISHAYHNVAVERGFDNSLVIAAYERAMEQGLYDSVEVHGAQGKAGPIKGYAATNHKEYFAELSVALLCVNDNVELNKWFPFNRRQLMTHDKEGYDVLHELWKI